MITYNKIKSRLMRAHRGAVKAGRLNLGYYLLKLINKGALIVSPVDDDAYDAALVSESCDCAVIYGRGYVKIVI